MKIYVARAKYSDDSGSAVFGVSTTRNGACAYLGLGWLDGHGSMDPKIEEYEVDEGLHIGLTAPATEQAVGPPVQPCWNCGESAVGEERWSAVEPHEVRCAQCGIWRRAPWRPPDLPAWRHGCGVLNDGPWKSGVLCRGCGGVAREDEVQCYRLVVES